MQQLPATLEVLYLKNATPRLPESDMAQVVAALAVIDQQRRFFIGRLLERQGEDALDALAVGLATGEDEVRRSAAFLLGRLLEGPHPALIRALQDTDGKVRKNAGIAIGRLGDAAAGPALLQALESEPFHWVRTSLILALGTTQPALLRAYQPGGPQEAEALRKAMDQDTAPPVVPALNGAMSVFVRSLPGLEGGLAAEATAQGMGLKPVPIIVQSTGQFSVTAAPNTLWRLRSMAEWLMPLDAFDWDGDSATLSLPPLAQLEGYHDAFPIPFRLELRHLPLAPHTQRRDQVPTLVARLAAAFPRWRNSPSRYSWELRLEPAGRLKGDPSRQPGTATPPLPPRWRWLAKPSIIADPRFTYRVQDIPASMSGPTAGGIMALAKPYLTQNAQVLDPCCGSGTLLFERLLAGHCDVTGVDIAHSALQAAQANDIAFKRLHPDTGHTRWIGKDILRYTPDAPYDELFANLPFGLRVGGHEVNLTLYEGLFAAFDKLLKPKGLLVLYSQEVQLLDKLSRAAPVAVLVRKRIEVGGLKPLLLILRWKPDKHD